jgi:hypothetical protein
MSVSPAQENEIISRWTSGQGIRSISRDMSLGRYVIARVIAEHQARTSSPSPVIGPKPITRKTKLHPFIDQLRQLLELKWSPILGPRIKLL